MKTSARKILKMGFTTMRATAVAMALCIVGKTLLGVDWSKLFSLDESADAKVEFVCELIFHRKAIGLKRLILAIRN